MIGADRGLVLRTFLLGETSRIVSLLGAQHGRLRLVARGVRAPRNRGGTSLEAGNEIEFVFSQKPASELGTLREATLLRAWLVGARRLEVLGSGMAVVELLERLLPEGASDPELLHEALGCLEALQASTDRAGALLDLYAFELRLLDRLGVGPDLKGCSRCGVAASGTFYLHIQAGVLSCARCGGRAAGRLALPPGVARALGHLSSADWPDVGALETSPRTRRMVGLALHRLLSAHVERYRYPRSLELLKNVDRQRA